MLGPEQLVRLDVVAQNVTVEDGAVVDGRHRGYGGEDGYHPPHLTGPWGPPGRGKADGGSHAGLGSAEEFAAEAYGSVYVPTMAGGGGENSGDTFARNGAHGGGVVWIEAAGTLRLDGRIDASGADGLGGNKSAAGAGGSVRLVAQRLEGTGTIDAGGGADSYFGGGGGRVTLTTPELLIDLASQVRVAGGIGVKPPPNHFLQVAGSGSLLVEDGGSVYGTLILDGGEIPTSPPIEQHRASILTALGSLAITATQAQGDDLLLYTGGEHLEAWLGAFARLDSAAGAALGTYRVLDVVDGSLLLEGAAAHAGTATTASGLYRFDRIEIRSAKLEATDPIEVDELVIDGDVRLETDVNTTVLEIAAGSTVETEGTLTTGTLTIGDGATLKPSGRSDLVIDVTGTFTVGVDAVVEVDGLGYGPGVDATGLVGEAPDHVTGSASGASHGGLGFDGSGIGEIFGSVYFPRELGGGGGSILLPETSSPRLGGDGGGLLQIRANDLVLNGHIRARGRERTTSNLGESWYGGAGGTVDIESSTLSGS
ncbi:MAG: hypothetical protein AAFX50_14995, partial [Acidobacteriota bacterium]